MNYVFDIETGPLPMEQIRAQMPEFIEADVKLGNRRDPEVIRTYVEEARLKHEQQWIERAALSPLTGSIIALGWLRDDGVEMIAMEGESSERTMIEGFFSYYQSAVGSSWIGFNVARFDLPFLIRRAWIHGVEVPHLFNGRYPASSFVDLLQLWQCGDAKEFISLDRLARYLALPGKTSDGSAFAALKYENPEAAREYLRHDLELTKAIAEKIYRPRKDPHPINKPRTPK